MNWRTDLETHELERLQGMLGSQKALAQYLGCSVADVAYLKLRAPSQIVRDMKDDVFIRNHLFFGGPEGMAKIWHVSRAFIDGEVKRRRLNFPENLDWSNLKEDLERLGSVRAVAECRFVSVSEVRRQCKDQGFDPKDHVRIEASGHFTAGLGRQAELAFMEMRGLNVLEDMNRTAGSKAPYDVLDREFGKVNVKSSQAYRSKRHKENHWKINSEGLDQCDYIAGALYDKDRTVVQYWWIRKVSEIDRTKKTITLRESHLGSDGLSQTAGYMQVIEGSEGEDPRACEKKR